MCVLPDGKKWGLPCEEEFGLSDVVRSGRMGSINLGCRGRIFWMGTDGDSMFLWYSGYPLVIELIDDLPHLRHQRSSATRNSSIKSSKNDKA